jgi:hypothetical protein
MMYTIFCPQEPPEKGRAATLILLGRGSRDVSCCSD